MVWWRAQRVAQLPRRRRGLRRGAAHPREEEDGKEQGSTGRAHKVMEQDEYDEVVGEGSCLLSRCVLLQGRNAARRVNPNAKRCSPMCKGRQRPVG